jgi:hypothetical protein
MQWKKGRFRGPMQWKKGRFRGPFSLLLNRD